MILRAYALAFTVLAIGIAGFVLAVVLCYVT